MASPDTPVMFFKRGKSRGMRARATSPSDEQAAAEGVEGEASPTTLAAKLKKQHKERAKPKARLSFGGEEEEGDGEVFQVKKSNLSRRVKLGTSSTSGGVVLPSNLDQASITPQSSGIVYSKEYLSELKASTLSTPPPSARQPAASYDSDLTFDASELAGAIIIDDSLPTEMISEIPSESSIIAAKEKRERIRQSDMHAKEGEGDFISLSVTRREETYQGPHPESRLVREEDELGEGDDEFAEYTAAQERIALGKKAKKKEAADRRSTMQVMIMDADEEDEETQEWEREQIRRGGLPEPEDLSKLPAKQEYRPAPIPPPAPLPTLDAAMLRLSHSLTELTTSHASSTTSMSSLADERLVLDNREKEMRTMVEKAEMKRSWFNAFREWVETVATFLDEKYPILEKLEDEHVSLLRERSEMISKRRLQDDEDDLSTFLGSLPAPSSNELDELDELGRVVPRQNPIIAQRERGVERAARRSRRRATREEEGYSTDSSLSPSDETDFQTAVASLQNKVDAVLQDVRSDEFRDPSLGVGKWFGSWRDKYSDTYTGAFGGLGMVSAWEFWVRLELLGWDPAADPRALDSFAWFSSLYEYSRPRPVRSQSRSADDMDEDDDVEGERDLGPDGDLVSAMVSTSVVPRLCKVIQGGAFDPYSARHIRVLIDLAEQVEASATQDKFELLVKAVITPFRQAVESTTKSLRPFLDLHKQARFDPEAIPARRRFLVRRSKLLSNLVRWRKYTGERFGAGELIGRIVSECMQPVAESGWDVGGEDIMRKVEMILPTELRQTVEVNGKHV